MEFPRYGGVDYEWFADQMATFIGRYDAQDPNRYLSTIPNWRRQLFYVGQATTAIMNGGVEGYLAGPYSDDVDYLLDVLEKIGANEMFKTLYAVKQLFPDSVIPNDNRKRIACIDEICEARGIKKLDEAIEASVDIDIWSLMRQLEKQSDHCEKLPE